MHDTDEQMRVILDRAELIRRRRRVRATAVVSACLCLVLITAMSLMVPLAKGELGTPSGSYASLIQSAPALGYVVVGTVAFLLGASVTLLCVRLAGTREKGPEK